MGQQTREEVRKCEKLFRRLPGTVGFFRGLSLILPENGQDASQNRWKCVSVALGRRGDGWNGQVLPRIVHESVMVAESAFGANGLGKNNAARGVASELTQEGNQLRPASTTGPEF